MAERRKRGPSGYEASAITIPARARSVGLSARALYKEIEEKRGPLVTFLSPRRRVILDADWAAWLKVRRDHPPAEVTRWKGPRERIAAKREAGETNEAPATP
jgi:hypothetical protein